MEKRVSYSVRLLPDVFKQLKLFAVQEDKTISAVLEEAIREYLESRKGKGK